MTERTRHATTLFAGIASEYSWMGALLSFGQDPLWRRRVADEVRHPAGALVLDVASGTGLVAGELGRHRYRVIRLDPSEPMVRASHETSPAVLGRAERLPFPDDTFDALAFTYLLRYVDDPGATLQELARVVRPGGSVVALEFHVPPEPWALTLWRLYTRRVLPVLGAAVSPAWADTGRFLGPSIETHWREHPLAEQLGWWRDAGFDGLRWWLPSFGAAIVVRGVRR
ncbi:MAG TPA: class I SAM-dependent methyltransferase [Actinomycetota bacterium]|jgi:demethylmenaquinone methyltransferase/2-methoxy-6-polyprenyl-1,4-benzoquinol methylase